MSNLNRRSFLRNAVVYGSGAVLAPSLAGLSACADPARLAGPALAARRLGRGQGGYGEPVPSADVAELALPPRFHAVKLSQAGDLMSDATPTPNAFDGMGAFPMANGNIRLIRNHEIRDSVAIARPFGNAAMAYDQRAGGGNSSLEVRVRPDGSPELVRHYATLTGTHVNCAGGTTPWGSWISCEETTEGPTQGRGAPHGYAFEIPVTAEDEVAPVPIKGMGRFVHEALTVDPLTGVVYLTEDFTFRPGDPTRPGSGLYRYIPNVRGNMLAGGRLQMLALKDRPRYDSTRSQRAGVPLPATWVDIADPDPAAAETDPSAVFRQGLERGGTIFQRLEGCWFGDGSVFFNATSGGDAGAGQVWQYRPRGNGGGQLILVFESPSSDVLDSPDNIVVSPRGGILVCEDGDGQQWLRGLSQRGDIFDFATNLANGDEFAGACFSPDGGILFVNIQGSTSSTGANKGITFAIWGPWDEGVL